jgi:hypothetical protein
MGSAVFVVAAPSEPQARPVVLKHRVEVIAPFSASPVRQGVDVTLDGGTAPPGNSTDGVTIQRDEWATALDELKLSLGQSPIFRPAEPVPSDLAAATPGATPAFELYARFGRVAGDFRVLLRLVQKRDGALVAATEGRDASLEKAIATAVAKVEKEMLRRSWRCQVTELIQDQLVIPFGRLDGFQTGQILIGFTLPDDVRLQKPMLNDLLLLKSGKKAGQYQVTEVTEEITLLKPLPQAGPLQPGDVLEAPLAKLHDLPRSSPSTIWDRIYPD